MIKNSKKISVAVALSTLIAGSLLANDDIVLDFEKKRMAQNPNVKIKSIKLNSKKELDEVNSWSGYIFDIEAVIQGKDIKAKDILFSDGKVVAPDLIDAKTGKSLKDSVTPAMTEKYYDKTRLIAGNNDAKDKVVVFSDPLCPFCQDYIPDIISKVEANSKNIALYYYAFPLTQIHPASLPLSKLIDIAVEKGVKDATIKAYKTDWEEHFDPKSEDSAKILEAFNKVLGTDIKIADLNKKEINAKLEKDIQMGDDLMVSGTPTLYVNGKKEAPSQFDFGTIGKE